MNKSYRKSELAELADVSYSTFYRFLRSHQKELAELGVSPKAQTVRGKALEYICLPQNFPYKTSIKLSLVSSGSCMHFAGVHSVHASYWGRVCSLPQEPSPENALLPHHRGLELP